MENESSCHALILILDDSECKNICVIAEKQSIRHTIDILHNLDIENFQHFNISEDLMKIDCH